MSTPADESLVALMGLLSFVLIVALYVWTALALSAVFRKIGEEPWKAWVPVLNLATVLKWGGFSPWLVLLAFVPVVGQLAVFVLMVISAHRINPGFGYGNGMTVLAALLFVVWASILGFGPARWLGARAVRPTGAPAASASAPVAPAPAARVIPSPLASPVARPDAQDGPVAAWDAEASASADDEGSEAAFAPPSRAAGGWTPPETAPRGAAPVGASAQPAPVSAVPTAGAAGPAPAVPAGSSHTDAADARADQALPDASLGSEAPVDSDAAWPSEIDDVSAIHPSPCPPSSAAGRPYVAPPVAEDDGPIAFVPGRRVGADAAQPPAPVTRVPAARRVESTPAAPATPVPSAGADPLAGSAAPATAAPAPAGSGSPAAARAARDAAIFAQPARARRTYDAEDPDAFPELSGEVSAVVGSPTAGTPRSAAAAVSAQHRRAEAGESARDAFAGADAERSLAEDDDLDVTVITRRAVRPTWELVPAHGSPLPLTASVVILGRRPSADPAFPTAQLVSVQDDARTVSKTHARIEQREDAWVVTDLGSTNGVLVRTLMGDEVEVEAGGQLDAGERFFLGDEEFHLRRITP